MSETKRKIVAAIIALFACILIGISAWALIGQGSSNNNTNETTELSSVQDSSSNSNSATGNTENSEGISNENSSSENSSSSNSTSSNNSSKSSGDSSSSADEQSDSVSSYVKISISITSDAVGNPVSASRTLTFNQGATVYDALCGTGLAISSSQSAYGVYVSSIGGLAEKQHGSNSGWMYSVNGTTPMTSCSSYMLNNGDSIVWYYVT